MGSEMCIRDSFRPVGFTDAPDNGTVVINKDGTVTYTPDAEFAGTDLFSYRGINDNGKTGTAQVSVNVNLNEMVGTLGDDRLIGSATSDRLAGLFGNDTIVTGKGHDVLVYSSSQEGLDTITDFEVGVDKIDLTRILGSSSPLSSKQVTFKSSDKATALLVDDSALAIFNGVSQAALEQESNFVF